MLYTCLITECCQIPGFANALLCIEAQKSVLQQLCILLKRYLLQKVGMGPCTALCKATATAVLSVKAKTESSTDLLVTTAKNFCLIICLCCPYCPAVQEQNLLDSLVCCFLHQACAL